MCIYVEAQEAFGVPTTVAKIHTMFEPFDQSNMIDEFQNRARPMNDCLLRVKVARWEDKPAMDKIHWFV